VIAEIWPSAFPLDASVSPIRDEAQVVSTLRAMADRQQAGWGRWFDPPSVGTSGSVRHSALEEEGWILGVH